MKKIKVCVMVRVSTSNQKADHQLTSLEAYCEMRGYEIVHTISTVVSGNTSNKKREDIAELLEEARKGKFSKVIVTEISRIGRRVSEIRKTLDSLHSMGISVVFKQLGVESLGDDLKPTFVGNLVIAIHSEQASYEREQLSQRIKSGLAHAKKNGRKPGRKPGVTQTPEEILAKYKPIVRSLKRGLSLRQCEVLHGVCRTTVVKIKKAMQEPA